MSKIIDIRKAQAALDKAAASKDRTGRFGLKTNMPRVKSSMMTAIDYDDDNNELDITFVGGKIYRYFHVPPEIYDDLLDADSKGEFFNECIKDRFTYREVVSK
jgi:hypothetical protein